MTCAMKTEFTVNYTLRMFFLLKEICIKFSALNKKNQFYIKSHNDSLSNFEMKRIEML